MDECTKDGHLANRLMYGKGHNDLENPDKRSKINIGRLAARIGLHILLLFYYILLLFHFLFIINYFPIPFTFLLENLTDDSDCQAIKNVKSTHTINVNSHLFPRIYKNGSHHKFKNHFDHRDFNDV